MTEIFADCLGVAAAQVDRDSDFFTLGGDSLAIAGLLARLEQESGSAFRDVVPLLACATPAGIATHLLELAGTSGDRFRTAVQEPSETWRELPERIDHVGIVETVSVTAVATDPEIGSIAGSDLIRVSHT